jgi:uncharacterized membrane protein
MTHPPSAAPSTLPPETLIALAYLGGWTTGALVWLIEREDRKVRFHAAQAFLVFGLLTVLWAGLWLGSFAVLTLSASGFTAFQRLSYAVLLGAVLLWLATLWMSWQRQSWRFPLVSPWADRLAAWRLAAR